MGEAPRSAFPAPLTALAAGSLPLAREQYPRGTVARGYCSAASLFLLSSPHPNDVHNRVHFCLKGCNFETEGCTLPIKCFLLTISQSLLSMSSCTLAITSYFLWAYWVGQVYSIRTLVVWLLGQPVRLKLDNSSLAANWIDSSTRIKILKKAAAAVWFEVLSSS
jgi:hypothetical protein